ncbi:MAG: UvrB/UvrC motif-containing protein [Candidatus Omnitrophica bacterium]|nr:UvrB/UvrC motif-containing protein [Candidatus Omnitrophota bacterium]
MVCQSCGVNEATIHLTEIVNNKIVELHICEYCAKEKEVNTSPPVSFDDILSGLFDFTARQEGGDVDVRCSSCGVTYEDFKKSGRLGCEMCYQSFQTILMPLIKRVHGSTQHLGKRPSRLSGSIKIELEIKELSEKLKKHIALEEFEEAVQIRDKIKMFEKKLNKKGRPS